MMSSKIPQLLFEFMQKFETTGDIAESKFAQGLFGYTTYDAVQFFDTIRLGANRKSEIVKSEIPLMRYRLYQYVIAINHFKDELFICENKINGSGN